jgi:hypothetical protein
MAALLASDDLSDAFAALFARRMEDLPDSITVRKVAAAANEHIRGAVILR